jgi:hypothetical protein
VRGLSHLAVVMTPIIAVGLLLPQTFIVSRCFQVGNTYGCSYERAAFFSMLTSATLQIAPALLGVGVLVGLATGAGWAIRKGGEDLAYATLAIGAYGFLIAGVSVTLGPFLIVPLLLLVADLARALGASRRRVVNVLGGLAILTLGAFAAAYVFAIAWGLRLGPLPIGGLDTLWLYVALAAAAALATGFALAVRSNNAGLILRGVVAGFAAFGLAALAVALVSLRTFYPHGTYVNAGLSGAWTVLGWLAVANVLVGMVALWSFARIPMWFAAFLAISLTLGALFGVAPLLALPVTGVSPAPPLLVLPSTSTLP